MGLGTVVGRMMRDMSLAELRQRAKREAAEATLSDTERLELRRSRIERAKAALAKPHIARAELVALAREFGFNRAALKQSEKRLSYALEAVLEGEEALDSIARQMAEQARQMAEQDDL